MTHTVSRIRRRFFTVYDGRETFQVEIIRQFPAYDRADMTPWYALIVEGDEYPREERFTTYEDAIDGILDFWPGYTIQVARD